MKKTGILFILFTSNNILCSFTDLGGSVITWTSAGFYKSKGLKKTIPAIISLCITKLALRIINLGFSNIHLKLKGLNKNKKVILKSLNQTNTNLLSFQDLTSLPHNGCRKTRKKRF